MNVITNIKTTINKQEFIAYLVVLVVSLLFIGYAPSSIALGVFVFFSLRYGIVNKHFSKPTLALLLPMLLYLLLIATLFWTIDFNLSLKGLGRLASLIVIPFTFLFIPKFTRKNQNLIFQYFTYANVGYGLFFIIVASIKYLKTKNLSVFTYHDFVSILELNAIYVSVFFAVSLFFLISKNKKSNLDKVFILFFINLLLLLSSKLLLIILFITFVIYLFFFKGIKYLRSTKAVLMVVVVLLIIAFSSKGIINRFLEEKPTDIKEVLYKEKFNKVYLWTGTSLRLFQGRIFYEQLKEENIFWKGFGVFASRVNLKKRHLEYNTYKGFHQYNYHNQYLQIFSETGVFGLVLLLSILMTMYIKSLKTNNFLFLMFSVLISMVFLTESFLWVQRGLIFFTMFYCVFLRTDYIEKKDLTIMSTT